MKWDAYANNDMEIVNFGGNDSAGDVDFADNSGCIALSVWIGASAANNLVVRTDMSAAAWHHFVVVMNRAGAGTADFIAYVDGNVKTQTQQSTERTITGNFANATLTLMPNSTGDLGHVAIYSGALRGDCRCPLRRWGERWLDPDLHRAAGSESAHVRVYGTARHRRCYREQDARHDSGSLDPRTVYMVAISPATPPQELRPDAEHDDDRLDDDAAVVEGQR